MIRNQKGFTLVELIVTMAVFIFVIIISTDAFNVILTQSSRLMRSEESNIEGMIGLEQFRHDIQQGGYGLPHQFPAIAPVYSEAAGGTSSTYNDAPSGVPRAYTSGDGLTGFSGGGTAGNIVNGSDYLAIRGSSVGRSTASQRWTYLRYSSSTPTPKTWPSANENIDNNAKVIVLNRTFSNGQYSNQLVTNSALASTPSSVDYYSATYRSDGLNDSVWSDTTAFNPTTANDIYFIYGLDKASTSSASSINLRMPFNRTDYFVSRPATNMPALCAPGSGILYKTTVNQIDGGLGYMPLVDCVADMQVIYGWDLKNSGLSGTDGLIDTYSRADGGAVSGAASIAEVKGCLGTGAQQIGYPSAAECIRTSLKLIKVYLLVQDGGKDKNYTSPATFELYDTGESALGRLYTLAGDMRNYRWKVYRITVRPNNLQSN